MDNRKMIYLDDAIEAVRDYLIECQVEDGDYHAYGIMYELSCLPSVQEQRWIPVTKRPPKKYIGEWLCCTDDGQILVLPYDTPGDGSKECVFYRWDERGDMYETYNVVAWMPLPEPYKGENR